MGIIFDNPSGCLLSVSVYILKLKREWKIIENYFLIPMLSFKNIGQHLTVPIVYGYTFKFFVVSAKGSNDFFKLADRISKKKCFKGSNKILKWDVAIITKNNHT